MKIARKVIAIGLASIILAGTGFLMKGWSIHHGMFQREGNELAFDLWQAGFVVSIGPPWYFLHKLRIMTPFDDRWLGGHYEINPDYWSFGDWYMWKDYSKFFIVWFLMLSIATFAYKFSKLGAKKAWERIRQKRK